MTMTMTTTVSKAMFNKATNLINPTTRFSSTILYNNYSSISQNSNNGKKIIHNDKKSSISSKIINRNQQHLKFSTETSSPAKTTTTKLFSWGSGDAGQLAHWPFEKSGIMQTYTELVPREVEGYNDTFVDISCGASYSAGITKEGALYTWGSPENFKLGHGETKSKLIGRPKLVEAFEGVKIVKVACGERHTAAIDSEGKLYTWGYGGSYWGGSGGLGLGSDEEQTYPVLVESLCNFDYKIKDVAVGESHTVILTDDGEVLITGSGEYGRMGDGGSSDYDEFVPVDMFADVIVKEIKAGSAYTTAITSDNTLYVWGRNDQGQLGVGEGVSMDIYSMESMPVTIEKFENKPVLTVGAGHSHCATILADDKHSLYMTGMKNLLEPQEFKIPESKFTDLDLMKPVSVSAGQNYTAVITKGGALYTFGKANSLCLGNPEKKHTPHPELVNYFNEIDGKVKKIACGQRHMMALVEVPIAEEEKVEETKED